MISKKVSRGMTALKTRLTTSRRSRISTAVEAASASSLASAMDPADELEDIIYMSPSMSRHTAHSSIASVDDHASLRRPRRATVAVHDREEHPRSSSALSEPFDEFQLPPPTPPYSQDEERARMNMRARMRHDIFTSEDEMVDVVTAAPTRSPVIAHLQLAAEHELISRATSTSEGHVQYRAIPAPVNLRASQHRPWY